MTGITIGDFARADRIDAVEHCDKHTIHRLVSKQLIGIGQTIRRFATTNTCGADQRTADCHEDGCGNTFTTDIGNHESDAVFIDAEEIVEIASHILRSIHRSGNIQLVLVLREWREDTGQDSLLDLACHSQVAFDRLQLGMFLLRLTDVIDLFDSFLDGYTQVIEVDGLRGEVKGAVVHRLADISHIAIG